MRTPEPFEEKEFYLEQFRGRSVLIAISPEAASARTSLRQLGTAVAELVRNDTRVLIWWPASVPTSERRLLVALGRSQARVARSGTGRRALPILVRATLGELAGASGAARLRATLWSRLRRGRLCALSVSGALVGAGTVADLAARLAIAKLVLVDQAGGLVAGSTRLSFVDEAVLEAVLRRGEAEWSGLGDRRDVLMAAKHALDGGVESVNVCTPEGIAEELFTYTGSGTLFTRGDYCRVAPLTLDEFGQAERLLERGQRDGVLKIRHPDEIAQVLSVGYGATIGERHLAGVVGLSTAPYAGTGVGEIVGLYTITRFKGEGIGERLILRLLADAEAQQLQAVFACAIDERAQQFFERLGFARVTPADVPAAKWAGYNARRRGRIAVLRRALPTRAR